MPRTADPNSVVDDAKTQMAASVIQYDRLRAAVVSLGSSAAEKKELRDQLACDALMRAAVAFESFRSDWYIRAINRSPSVFKTRLQSEFAAHSAKKLDPLGLESPTLTFKHLTVQSVQDILDPKGMNLELSDAPTAVPGTAWKFKAGQDLTDPFRAKVRVLPGSDMDAIDAVIRIRNAIAHRSLNAMRVMNNVLANPALGTSFARQTNSVSATGIGAYLAAAWDGVPRVTHYHLALEAVIEKLRVP